jgi:methyltransferase (TIGR00027 family)
MRRAAHQLLDRPKVFDDPLALSILGPQLASPQMDEILKDQRRAARSLRAFLAVRSRYAEDQLAAAVATGVWQYVVLGAGLDTFAYRNPHRQAGLRVFEVDHPSTQAWKRDQLRTAGIRVPDDVVYASTDFEQQSLAEALERVGFRTGQSAFFSWLGVVPYLTEPAFTQTLAFIAAMPWPSGVVFDYAAERSTLSLRERLARDALAERVASAGEPFQLFFGAGEAAGRLQQMGFRDVEDLSAVEINARYFRPGPAGLWVRGAHLLRAWR